MDQASQRLEVGGGPLAPVMPGPKSGPVERRILTTVKAAPSGPPLHRDAGVALGHLALHLGRAAHRIDDATKLHQQPAAGSLDDAAVVLLDLGVGQVAPQRL
jgi:hypothetical protein